MLDFEINLLRDTALRIQNDYPELAFELIERALYHRPNGPMIKKIHTELKNKLNIVNVALIGNCQAAPLAGLLKEKNSRIRVLKVVTAHLHNEDNQILYKTLDLCDFIVTQNLSLNFPGIDTATISSKYPGKIIKILNLFYQGFHQDWCYMPTVNGVRLQSPAGDYHNETIIKGFIRGDSESSVLEKLNSYEYNFEEYASVAKKSFNELCNRELDVDIKMTDYLGKLLDNGEVCFHSFNHPNKKLLNEEANRIVSHIGLANNHEGFYGDCLDGVVLRTNPVNNVIAPPNIFSGTVDVLNFIKESYKVYSDNPEFLERFRTKKLCEGKTF